MEVVGKKISSLVNSNIDTDKPVPVEVTGDEEVVSETTDSKVNTNTGKLEFDIFPNPEANVTPRIKEKVEKDLEIQEVEKEVSYGTILSGQTTEVNGEEINPVIVQRANQGDIDAISEIEALANTAKKAKDEPKVAGLRGGEISPPALFSNDPADSKASKEFVKYAEGRQIVLSALKQVNPKTNMPRVSDGRTQQLLVDYYSTGQFFTELGRRTAEIGRGVGLLPVLTNMAYNVFGAATDSIDLPDGMQEFIFGESENYPSDFAQLFGFQGGATEETFSKSWQKRQQGMAEFFNYYKTQVEKVMPGLTFASAVNDDLKEKYIETYGIDEYNKFFTIQNNAGKTVELPMISEDMGQDLLKIGFNELPMSLRATTMIVENVGIGGAIGKGSVLKGAAQFKDVDKIRKADPTKYKGVSNVEVLRRNRIEEARNEFTKAYYKTTANIGRKLRNRGAIGAAEVDINRENTIGLLDKQIASVQKQMNKKGLNARELGLLNNQLENLETQRTKFVFPYARNTFTKTVIADETVMGLGQAVGYEIADHFGFNRDVGEVVGALSTATKIPQLIVKKSIGVPFRFLDNLAGNAVSNFAATIEALPFIPKGTFVDRRFDLLTDEMGDALTGKQKVAVEEVAKMIKNLDPAKREMVWNSIDEYQTLRGRILQKFKDPEKKERARGLFNLSFSHISGLAPLIALERRSAGKLKANAKNMGEAVEYQLASEESLEAATEAVAQLKRMISEDSGIDLDDNEFLTNFANNFQKAADAQQLSINETKIEYLKKLSIFKNNMIDNPDVPIDNDLISQLAEMEIKLTAGAVGDVETQRRIYQETTEKVTSALAKRGRSIMSLRGEDGYKNKLGQFVEDVYDTHQDSLDAKGKLAYKPVDEMDFEFDITSLIDDMAERREQLSSKELRTMFGADGEFFKGNSGRKARAAFDSMALRGVKKQLGLNSEQFAELRAFHTNPATIKNFPDEYLGENASILDIALHLSKKEGTTFKPFTGSPSELDEMRRHFNRTAKRLTNSNESLSRKYTQYGESIESILKSNPEVYRQIYDARKRYKAIHFDPSRDGSLGDKLDDARTGPMFEERGADGYKHPYRDEFKPEDFHDDFGKNIQDIMDGTLKSKRTIEKNMSSLVRYWTAGDMPDNSMIFDASTLAGQKKLEVVGHLVRASIYEHWGEARKAVLDKLKTQVRLGNKVTVADYNFGALENFEKLKGIFDVKVKGVDGKIQSRSLVDLQDIVAEEKELINLMELSVEANNKYKNLATEINDTSSLLRERMAAKLQVEGKSVNKLEEVSGTKNSERFYEVYIENGSPSSIRDLKNQFIDARTKEKGVTEAMAAQEFKEGMIFHVNRALLSRAEMGRAERTLTGLDGKPFNLSQMAAPGKLAEDLGNKNTQKILKEIGLEEDHIEYLDDIANYFEYAQGTSLSRYDITGHVRGLSPNELISRSFNLARGMVSPTYVVGEMSARLLIAKGNELVVLAAQSKDAARIIGQMLQNPRTISKEDIKTFGTLLKEFAATEVIRTGTTVPSEYIPKEKLSQTNLEYQGKPLFEGIFSQNRKKQPLEELYEEDKTINKENKQ